MSERKFLRPWKTEHSICVAVLLLLLISMVLDTDGGESEDGLKRHDEAVAKMYPVVTVEEIIEKIPMPAPDRITLLSERVDGYQKRMFKLQERVEALEKEVEALKLPKTCGAIWVDGVTGARTDCSVAGCDCENK